MDISPPRIDDEQQLPASQDDTPTVTDLLNAWRAVVDVQKHFNDVELRTRSLAVTLLGATLAAVGYLSKDVEPGNGRVDLLIHFRLLGFEISPPVALFTMALILVLAFWIMDRHWYHRLLVGAVKTGEDLEERLAKLGLRADLARAIRAESAIQFFREPVTQPFGRPLLSWLSERRSLVSMLQERELQSYGRVDLFYLVLASFCPLAMAASVSALWSILTLAILAVLWRIWWETAFTAPGTGY